MAGEASDAPGILDRPAVYDAFQSLMGAGAARRRLVSAHIRPAPGMRLLDLGCGTARILDHLPAEVEYWGQDRSAEYIAAARARYGARAHFGCASVGEPPAGGPASYDVVLAIGVLHHLDDQLAGQLMDMARGLLAAGGRLVTVDPCLAPGQHPVARFLIRRDRGRFVRDEAGYLALARRAFGRVAGTLRHQRWIPYTNWIMECAP